MCEGIDKAKDKCYNYKGSKTKDGKMNILVLSDSHSRRSMIEEAIARQIKKPDAIIFLGDGLRDIVSADIGDIPVYSVAGNCDAGSVFFDSNTPTEQNLIIGDKRIFFTHGHKYGVKSTLSPLLSEGVKRGADIILFGHTHMPFERVLTPDNDHGIKTDKSVYIMNPGSIGDYPYCFGNITIDREGRVLLSHGTVK
jgi:putative phosphoesterase